MTARKQSLGQDNNYTCLSVHREGVGFPPCVTGHMTSLRAGVCLQGDASRGGESASGGTRKAGSTHPTGMLSC